jgi:hypothetical protein
MASYFLPLLMSVLLETYLEGVIGLTGQNEILAEFAFLAEANLCVASNPTPCAITGTKTVESLAKVVASDVLTKLRHSKDY